ncbi:MAG: ABC transporter substrate-binding protein, partial [Planctomycetota bacterium]
MPPADSTPGAEPTAEPAGRALERLEGLLERLLRACPEEFEDAPLARWLDEVRTSLGAERASSWRRDGGARRACRAAAPPPASPPPSVDAPAVLGALDTMQWSPDLDNEANKKFVSQYREKFGRYPSFYAAQAYDAINLINSAMEATGGKVEDKDAFRAALKAANYDSVRGKYSYGNN